MSFFGKGDKKKKTEEEAASQIDENATVDGEETSDEQAEVEAPEQEEISPEAQAAEWKDKYVRALAELENFRKRTDAQRADARRFATESLMRDLLPVLDALGHACCAEGDGEAIREGVKLAQHDLLRILGENGMTEIEAMGQLFDPRVHEAMGMIPSEEHPAGTVIFELAKGYVVHERVLRPSRVQIAMAPPAPPEEEPSEKPDEESTEEAND